MDIITKSEELYPLLLARRAERAIGVGDVMSAILAVRAKFKIIQVSGFQLAATKGFRDSGLVPIAEIIDLTARIVSTVPVPVMADLDTGGLSLNEVALNTRLVIDAGAAGFNIEDQLVPKWCGHIDEPRQLISPEQMCEKIHTCRRVAEKFDPNLVINARTDAVSAGLGLDEAIKRCKMYWEAGATMVFVDAIRTKEDIQTVLNAISGGLLSVNLMDGVTGVKTELIPVHELAKIGVARVSIPIGTLMLRIQAESEYLHALYHSPTGTLPKWIDRIAEFDETVKLLKTSEQRQAYGL